MLAVKGGLIVFGVIVLTINASRVVRTPDKMEVNIPDYTTERETGEYQESMKDEAMYWQGQGEKVVDREEEGQQQLDEERDKNLENYNNEKDYYAEKQNNYNKEMNDTYQEDRNKVETLFETNPEHYAPHNSTNFDLSNQDTAEGMTETETGDRYEEKRTEYMEDGQDKIENPDVEVESPSISYTRT